MKSIIYRFTAFVLSLFFLSIFYLLYPIIRLFTPGPLIITQKRMGKDRKPFPMYKLRTMVLNAEKLKKKYFYLNEADGPVFKIRDDPRYTRIGKFLSHTGLDELPQIINIIRGEMSFVGPRPLPLSEGRQVPKKYQARFSVLPGLTSPWIIKGAHELSFKSWMELDLEYMKNQSFLYDLKILLITIVLVIRQIFIVGFKTITSKR